MLPVASSGSRQVISSFLLVKHGLSLLFSSALIGGALSGMIHLSIRSHFKHGKVASARRNSHGQVRLGDVSGQGTHDRMLSTRSLYELLPHAEFPPPT